MIDKDKWPLFAAGKESLQVFAHQLQGLLNCSPEETLILHQIDLLQRTSPFLNNGVAILKKLAAPPKPEVNEPAEPEMGAPEEIKPETEAELREFYAQYGVVRD